MSNFDSQQLAASELADRYIEIVLSNSPEIIMAHMRDAQDASSVAAVITQFRQSLINGISAQPISTPALDD